MMTGCGRLTVARALLQSGCGLRIARGDVVRLSDAESRTRSVENR